MVAIKQILVNIYTYDKLSSVKKLYYKIQTQTSGLPTN